MFGSSYEIAVLIVTPNMVNTEGEKQPESDYTPDILVQDAIELKDVKFAYPSIPNVEVLKGVSINVVKNQVVALVGHSGCGKSSVISLIERFYDPIEGKVLFSNEDLRDLDNKWYHQKQLALVQQEPLLFSCSIIDNICYGVDFGDATEDEKFERVKEACRVANALSFIQDEALFP